MKVAFVFEHLGLGGVEKIYSNLINYIRENYTDVSIYVLCETDQNLLYKLDDTYVFDMDYIKFRDIIYKSNPDIIWYVKGNLLKYDIFLNIKRSKKHKTVVSLHNPIISHEFSIFTNLKRLFGSYILYRYVDFIRTISEEMKQEIIKYARIDPNKVEVIYNPIINNKDKEDFVSIDINFRYFLGVGRLEYQKNFEEMIEIYELLIQKYPEYKEHKLLIIGDGTERKKLELIVKKKNLSEKVLFIGIIKNPKIYMKNAECLWLTSRYEGFPTVLVEAASVGCPFVAYDCKFGPREISKVLNFGHIVKYKDKSEFVDTVVDACKAKNEFLTDYDSTKYLENIDLFYLSNSANRFVEFMRKIIID